MWCYGIVVMYKENHFREVIIYQIYHIIGLQIFLIKFEKTLAIKCGLMYNKRVTRNRHYEREV